MKRAALLLTALLLAACDRPAAVAPANVQTANVETANVQAPPANSQAPAAEFPALTGRVVDNANLLSPEQEARLTQLLAALETRTTDQLVVATVPSLNGQSIEAYATALANHWELGQAGRDNGVLLLVAPAEQRTRIAVGYGLEPILTNREAGEIIDRDMVPRFREQAFADGIQAGANAIVAALVAQQDVPRRGR